MNIREYSKKGGIQRKLIISFLLLGLIPMVIMGSVSYYKSTDILLKNANSEMISLIKKSIELLDLQFSVYRMQMEAIYAPSKQVIDMLQLGINVDVGNIESLEKSLLEIVKSYPALRRISIFDGSGDLKIVTNRGGSDLAEKASSLPWHKQASTSKDIIFGEVYVPKGMGDAVTTMVKPFLSPEGKPYAFIAVDISVEQAAKPITNIKIGKEGFAYIINKEGMVIAHPDKTKT